MSIGAIGKPTVAERRPPDDPVFYSVAETARLFGMSEMTLYRAIHAGQFPAVQIRGRYIVPVRAISEMVDAALGSGGLVNAASWVPGGAA